MNEPCFLTAAEAAQQIRDKTLTCEALVRSCLDRIAERDPVVKAWLYVDPDRAIAQAREIDKRPPAGPLHGIPFGAKDIIDTRDMPTTHNSPIYQENRPANDAPCVAIVRAKGGMILGKTDTVEFAAGGRKAATGNPFNTAHTPGGSSSGSGAAVGDCQVPMGFGTQTAGSHIRPASFNGIYGIKPTWGTVTAVGIRQISASLDTLGWYGRSVDDLILGAEAFHVPGMAATRPSALKGLRVAVCRTPFWNKIEPSGERALEAAADRLRQAGAVLEELDLPAPFDQLYDVQTTLMNAEAAANFLAEYLTAPDKLHDDFRQKVENDSNITAEQLVAAYDISAECRREFEKRIAGFDTVLTPSAPGEAPEGLQTTGDWVFNSMWTVMHMPCVAIPCITGAKGLPVGIQLVGPRCSDARLLQIAKAAAPAIDAEGSRRAA